MTDKTLGKYSKISEDGLVMDLKLAHLHRHDFNPHGHISPWRLAQIFETGRTVAHYIDSFFTGGLINQGYSFFTIVMEYDIKPELYLLDNHKPFETGMFVPVRLHHELLAFKKTSGTFRTTLYNERSGTEMATLKFKYVLINFKTRRSTQLPGEYRHKIDSAIINRKTPRPEITYKVKNPPDHAYQCEFTVQSSDTDVNRHTNNTSYIRFCWNAVAKAFREDNLPQMTGRIEDYRVTRMNVYYAKECKEGDKLVVSMWSDGQTLQWLHFVFRLGSNHICHISMELKHKSALIPARL